MAAKKEKFEEWKKGKDYYMWGKLRDMCDNLELTSSSFISMVDLGGVYWEPLLELIYKYAECECLMLNTHFLTECNLSERAVITEYYRGSDFEGEWIKNCFKELGIIEILQISNERLEKEIIKQSVKNDVNLSVLTYCGLIKIFDGLMESVLLNK